HGSGRSGTSMRSSTLMLLYATRNNQISCFRPTIAETIFTRRPRDTRPWANPFRSIYLARNSGHGATVGSTGSDTAALDKSCLGTGPFDRVSVPGHVRSRLH